MMNSNARTLGDVLGAKGILLVTLLAVVCDVLLAFAWVVQDQIANKGSRLSQWIPILLSVPAIAYCLMATFCLTRKELKPRVGGGFMLVALPVMSLPILAGYIGWNL